MKKIFFYSFLAIILYAAAGSILLKSGVLKKHHFLPGRSANLMNDDEDDSKAGPDGPVIIYDNGKIRKFQISPEDIEFSIIKTEISKEDTLECFVDETKETFRFLLNDSLKIQPCEHEPADTILAVSDIEGNFKGLKMILSGNKIIDENFNWSFGDNHLVLVGDFFDRGLNVTECLWLIYKLENEAERQGGKVHFILGNHEMMNLKGQLKYLRNKYKENADTLELAYNEWYSINSELGRWLRTKNIIEKIGTLLFVHAGVRKDFPESYTIQQINDSMRYCIDYTFTKEEQRRNLFIGNESPIWYRGISKEQESGEDVSKTLAKFGAGKMIVGHTIVEKIKYLYGETVIDIDLYHKQNSDGDKMFALWIENGDFFSTDNNGNKSKIEK